ncbi:MAG: glycoside hydrolase [bacterium]|nr:glycoside hydrolase [bacterium]
MHAKTLLVIHHTHTDIGYTEQQQRIENWQVDFIRQAMDIIKRSRDRVGKNFSGYRWVCESFRAVELFLEQASDREIEELGTILRRKEIGLSGNYLNFNELPDRALMNSVTRRAHLFGRDNAVKINAAMTADINGFGPGFARALLDNGINKLFTCIHTHHGMYPLGRTQVPFWWETPRGDRLLVWSGEHYHFGNDLGVVPGAVSSYLIKDECDATMIFGDNWPVAELRIPRYFEQLATSGYQFDFVPVMASGLRTDNAPPSEGIIDFIERWNMKHGHEIRIEMATLSEFFDRLRRLRHAFPSYRGDWPDWWSDGPASNPSAVRIFRQAQRDLALYRALLGARSEIQGQPLADIETELAVFAEHTFNHSASVSNPWHFMAHTIPAVNLSSAAIAGEETQALIDDACEQLGAATLQERMPLRYRAINPFQRPRLGPIRLKTNHFEFNELGLNHGAEIIDLADNRVIPCRLEVEPRGGAFCGIVDLKPGEMRDYELRPLNPEVRADSDPVGSETWQDCPGDTGRLETDHVRIDWRLEDGLISWFDKAGNRELLRPDRVHNVFTPVYEITRPLDGQDLMSVRSAMGLNRKGPNVERSAGRLIGVRSGAATDIYSTLQLDYETPGTRLCTLELRAWHDTPRVDATLRLHKTSRWEPENLYLALPFGGAERLQVILDRSGSGIRPRLEQIPGTLTDFYTVQSGFALGCESFGMSVAMPDQHLLQIGPLEHGERLLAGDKRLADDPELLYAWLMTNYWETNFNAELGGFHEFRYHLAWGAHLAQPAKALNECDALNQGITCFRLKR